MPPAWLTPAALTAILEIELEHEEAFSPGPVLAASKTTSSEQYLEPSALEMAAPFLPSCTAAAASDALPYHWLELSHMLLSAASDDFDDPDSVRRLLRDLREVRMSKLRKGVKVLDAGGGVQMNGVGAMEIAECRSFITGVVDGLRYVAPPMLGDTTTLEVNFNSGRNADNLRRKLGASREQSRRERESEDDDNGGYPGSRIDNDDDEDML